MNNKREGRGVRSTSSKILKLTINYFDYWEYHSGAWAVPERPVTACDWRVVGPATSAPGLFHFQDSFLFLAAGKSTVERLQRHRVESVLSLSGSPICPLPTFRPSPSLSSPLPESQGVFRASSGITSTSCTSASPHQRCSDGLACRVVTQTTPLGRVCPPVSSLFDSIGGTYTRHRDCSRHEEPGRVEKTEESN